MSVPGALRAMTDDRIRELGQQVDADPHASPEAKARTHQHIRNEINRRNNTQEES